MRKVAEELVALPLEAVRDAALEVLADAGAEHGDVRIERNASQRMAFRGTNLESRHDGEDVGFAVRVVHHGTWGFASGVVMTADSAAAVARRALEVAKMSQPLAVDRVELADEPVHADVEWASPYEIDPFTVDPREKVERMVTLSQRLLDSEHVQLVTGSLVQEREGKHYADLAGTRTTQERVRVHAALEAVHVDPDGGFETMRTLAPPQARGWEWLVGGPASGCWDWDEEVARIPEWLHQKVRGRTVRPGAYDLVIAPSNLWLTIHESVGHATELDRALGYEAAYAGTSFATIDRLGLLQYGSPIMHVTGDRTEPHGLATTCYDDEGVATSKWDLVRDGVLVGYQLDRHMAKRNADLLGTARSNGCAFADAPSHVPIQRMANVSLQADPHGPSTEELIAGVEHGIFVEGDKSWSIDMQRYNFQFTGQRFFEIRGGKLAGQLTDVAYQATTTEFWASLEVLGGPTTYVLGGAMNCGKGQPGQVASVSHGCPAALFRGVNVLNTKLEGGR